jgi:hypothetical protein
LDVIGATLGTNVLALSHTGPHSRTHLFPLGDAARPEVGQSVEEWISQANPTGLATACWTSRWTSSLIRLISLILLLVIL